MQAAGAVLWREERGRLEVALVHRPRYQDWSWPKGKLEPGEPVAAAAVREVEEETGTPITLGSPLPLLRYRTPDGAGKMVRYWAAAGRRRHHAAPLAARPPVEPAQPAEIDDVAWVSPTTAREMLTRPTEPRRWTRSRRCGARVGWTPGSSRSPGTARPCRATAGRARSRPPADLVGRRQAEAIVPVLAAFGVRSVVTSPWERCRRPSPRTRERTGVRADPSTPSPRPPTREDPARSAVVEDLLARPATSPSPPTARSCRR